MVQYQNLYSGSGTVANFAVSAVAGLVGLAVFIGFILFLVAMYGFSKDYGESRIFNYIIYGIIAAIVAGIVAFAVILGVFFANLASLFSNFSSTSPPSTEITASMLSSISPFLVIFAAIGLMVVVLEVLAFNLLAKKSGVPLFRTGGWVLLAGGVLSVVVGAVFAGLMYNTAIDYQALTVAGLPGGLVQNIGWAIIAFAFFRIKPPTPQTPTQPEVASAASQVAYCIHCGAPNPADAVYCSSCGKKQ
jgi:uncharacterized membrane protein/ribosomal protein L40E